MSERVKATRRGFLRGAAGIFAFPSIVSASALGQGGTVAPSDRITMACIGVGGRGKQNLRSFMGHAHCRIVAVCDVNANRAEEAKKIVDDHYGNADCATYRDYRDVLARGDIDAVSIATPDAWHVLQAVEAARAGKDIFLEKPLGLSVKDDIALREAVRGYDRVFQFGTQQRSDRNFGFACELVQNGRIGKLQRIIVSTPASRAVGLIRPAPVPAWLHWDMWVGPAAWRPYSVGIVGNCGEWGHISNFSLGWITTWGIHHIDIAQWGNDADHTGPVEVEGTGEFPPEGLYDCATAWDMTLKYANGVEVRFIDKGKRRQGVLFEGTDGWVFVERGVIETEPASLLQERIGPTERHFTISTDHWGGFLDCIKSRKTPVSSIESAVRTDTVCHICDIAMRLGRKLCWDPAAEQFVNDTEANRMLTRAWRSPWHL
jgi:predicted dehydrogenase